MSKDDLIRCEYCGEYYHPNATSHLCVNYPNSAFRWWSPLLTLLETKLDRIIELLEELIRRTK